MKLVRITCPNEKYKAKRRPKKPSKNPGRCSTCSYANYQDAAGKTVPYTQAVKMVCQATGETIAGSNPVKPSDSHIQALDILAHRLTSVLYLYNPPNLLALQTETKKMNCYFCKQPVPYRLVVFVRSRPDQYQPSCLTCAWASLPAPLKELGIKAEYLSRQNKLIDYKNQIAVASALDLQR